MEVEGVGPATFTQAAGFLKLSGGDNPLDRTWVHPESYPTVEKLLTKLEFAPEIVRQRDRLPELHAKLDEADPAALSQELEVGEPTLRDIFEALARPERDPRDDLPKPIFKKGVLKLEDLEAGMELKGTVLNVVDFGAFVDIGLKDSGLVHISQLANRYIKSPHDVVSVGDVVSVWVMGVDGERKRVSLTMVKPGTERPRSERGPAPANAGGGRRPQGEGQEGRGGPRRPPGPGGPRREGPPPSQLTAPPAGGSAPGGARPGGDRPPVSRPLGRRWWWRRRTIRWGWPQPGRLAIRRTRRPGRPASRADPDATNAPAPARQAGPSATAIVQGCPRRQRPTPQLRPTQATLGRPRRARRLGRGTAPVGRRDAASLGRIAAANPRVGCLIAPTTPGKMRGPGTPPAVSALAVVFPRRSSGQPPRILAIGPFLGR